MSAFAIGSECVSPYTSTRYQVLVQRQTNLQTSNLCNQSQICKSLTMTPTKRVALTTSLFEKSLVRHLDNTKPDPLAKRQMEGWTCEWQEEEEEAIGDTLANSRTSGLLSLHGDYMTVILKADCEWTWEEGDSGGSLEFSLSVRTRFRTKAELGRDEKKVSSSDVKVDKKVRAGMLKRLQKDDYIIKILGDDFIPLCQATVLTKTDQLEERVWMDQDLLESIRRAIYSQASMIDVVELLTNLPYLGDCPPGHRAKLRLLEDAMLDACDREGDEELIDELNLQSSKKEQDETGEQAPKKKKHG